MEIHRVLVIVEAKDISNNIYVDKLFPSIFIHVNQKVR